MAQPSTHTEADTSSDGQEVFTKKHEYTAEAQDDHDRPALPIPLTSSEGSQTFLVLNLGLR